MAAPHRTPHAASALAAPAVRAIMGALIVLGAGCIPLVGPGDPPATPPAGPRFHVVVQYLDAGETIRSPFQPWIVTAADSTLRAPAVVLHGALEPGRPDGRRARSVESDTVRVLGLVHVGTRPHPDSVSYRAVIPTPAARFAERAVDLTRVPRLAGVAAPAHQVAAMSGVGRLDSSDVALAPDSDLRLRVALPTARPALPANSAYERWGLTVYRPGATPSSTTPAFTELGGQGAPPSVLVVPASMLPVPSAGESFLVRLTYEVVDTRAYAAVPSDTAYHVSARAITYLRWNVRRAAGRAAGRAAERQP